MATSTGLEGVVVAETELSDVDGERGELILRGFLVEDLVGRATVEDVCALLWTGRLPTSMEQDEWRSRLGMARAAAFDLIPTLGQALALADGVDALGASLGHLQTSGDLEQDRLRLTAATA